MKLTELYEQEILNAIMIEMANLFPANTGLPVAVWFGEVGGHHGPRIKVSNLKGKFSSSSNFVVSVSKEPKVLTPSSVKLKKDEVENIIDWIKLNYDSLMEMWKIYESGDGDLTPILAGLKKI
jgi:hypothetical protein